MISTFQIIIIAFAYVCLLFFIAHTSDKNKPQNISSRKKALVYSFSLAVYCTSWTFYGAVGSAAEIGWGYLPIYLGPILMYTIGWSFIKRLVLVAHQQNATSISDFIASRYDKSQSIAALVTIIAVVATIPYIALQLKAITIGIQAFGTEETVLVDQYSNAFYIAIMLIVFSILFGTRNIEVTEHQYGMMNAIAFESIVKLVTFLAVGFFALYYIFDGPIDLYDTIVATPRMKSLFLSNFDFENFIIQTFLAAGAIFCLPRQFHVSVVEYHQSRDLKYARFIFPAYLLLFSLFIIPIVIAGSQVFYQTNVSTDFYVLFLPISQGQTWLGVFSFIGGLSAATGMVIVSAVTLSTMVSNDLLLPNLLRISRKGLIKSKDLNTWILSIRRLSIALLLLGAYVFYRIIDTTQTLASFGLVSFSAVVQFAPALVIGMFWPRANKKGALSGLILGISCWLYFIWPALNGERLFSPSRYFDELSTLTEAVLFSILANTLAIVIVSIYTKQSLTEKIQSLIYTQKKGDAQYRSETPTLTHEIRVRDLKSMATIIIGEKRTEALFNNYIPAIESDNQIADQEHIEFTENILSGVIGAPSARVLLLSALKDKGIEIENVFSLINSTSQALKFNRNLLDITMDNITQGISVIDSEKKLVGWNESYVRLMNYPEELLQIGVHIEKLIRFNATRGYCGPGSVESHVKKRMKHLNSGQSYQFERMRGNNQVIEMKGHPLPGGGYVTTYTDISEYKKIESELRYKEQQIALYTDNSPALLAYIDKNLIFRFVNKAFAQEYKLTKEDIIGHHFDDVMPQPIVNENRYYIDLALLGEKQHFESSSHDDEVAYFINTYIPNISDISVIEGVYIVAQDISHRRKAELALQEINITLEKRVLSRTEELNNTVLALEQAKTIAEKAYQSKSRFMAAASHDLLQPFNAARLFCEILMSESKSMKTHQMELIHKTDQSLNVAGNIILSLVESIKLDRGNVVPHKKVFLLQELLGSLEEQFIEFSTKKGIKFKALPTNHLIYSDPKLLYRILQNFVSNAMRYTPRGGILITNRVRGDQIQISVWDTGIGIKEEQLSDIFEEFKQFPSAEIKSEDTGLGLGLSISQRTADMLGHNITVKSEPGRGSAFHIFVDKAENAALSDKKPEKKKYNFIQDIKNTNILCVDNNLQTLDAMAELLTSWKYNVRTCSHMDEIEQIKDNGFMPDILIVDYQLDDGKTGVDFVEAFCTAIDKTIPAIFVSANYAEEVRQLINGLGYELLHKPVKPARLRATIGNVLRNSKERLIS